MRIYMRLSLSTVFGLLSITILFWLAGCSAPLTKSEVVAANSKPVNHVVLVWFKDGTKQADIDAVIRETKRLPELIPQVKTMRLGIAIASDRKIVDDSFDLGIYFLFASQQAMQTYLKHPKHVAFVNQFVKPHLAKIVVYDF